MDTIQRARRSGLYLAPTSRAFAELDPPFMRERRAKLVEQLLRLGDLATPAVIDAFLRVPRHLFVPAALREHAYENRPLSIGSDQTISQPTVVAMMTEALELTGVERVLEIGTGSGYQAAVLSLLAAEVFSVERVAGLERGARALLARAGFHVSVRLGDGYGGWPAHAPYNRVVLTAAPPELPSALVEQLVEGGLLVGPLGPTSDRGETLVRGRKEGQHMQLLSLGPVSFVPMVPGAELLAR